MPPIVAVQEHYLLLTVQEGCGALWGTKGGDKRATIYALVTRTDGQGEILGDRTGDLLTSHTCRQRAEGGWRWEREG